MNKDIHEFLNDNGYSLEKELLFNKRKGQFTAIIRKGQAGDRYILKYQAPLKGLVNEINFYKSNSSNKYIAKLISYSQNCLILDYYEGKTLQDFLETEKDKAAIAYVLGQLNDYICNNYDLSKIYIDAEVKKELLKIFNRLLTSGTKDKKRFFAIELFFVVVVKLISPILKLLLPNINHEARHKQQVHGDFHLNNILVLDNKTIKIIDWENNFKSSPLVDLLYISPMIEKKVGYKQLDKFQFYQCLPNGVKKAMRLCIKMNSKF